MSAVLSPAMATRLLWAAAKFNRHPGGPFLSAAFESLRRGVERHGLDTSDAAGAAANDGSDGAASSSGARSSVQQPAVVFKSSSSSGAAEEVEAATDAAVPSTSSSSVSSSSSSGGAAPGRGPCLADLAVCLYSLAVLRDLGSPFARWLSAQLTSEAAVESPAWRRRSPLACAALLAAQPQRAADVIAAYPQPLRAALLEAWRRRTLKRAGEASNPYQRDLLAALKKLGLRARPNAVTPDGCVCPDVVVRVPAAGAPPVSDGAEGGEAATDSPSPSPSGSGAPAAAAAGGGAAAQPQAVEWVALELVGPHNTSQNSQRLLASAVLKWRLLQARGYRVVPVSCRDWRRISGGDQITKLLYLQSKLGMPAGAMPMAAPDAGSSAALPEPPSVDNDA